MVHGLFDRIDFEKSLDYLVRNTIFVFSTFASDNKPIIKSKMMKDAEKTVGNMIDKLKTAFIGSIDGEGFPTIKAMLQPRKRKGIKTIYLTTNTSSMRVE